MTLSLNRNNVPLTQPVSLLNRFSQRVSELVTVEKAEKNPVGVQFKGVQAPETPAPAPVSPNPAPAQAAPGEQPILSQMTLPTRAVWRAWREKSESSDTMVLQVAGLCPFVPGVNGRVVLQEVVTADSGHHWGGAGPKSGILTLERLLVPPALGEDTSGGNPQQVRLPAYPWCYPWEMAGGADSTQPLLITYRKEERNSRPLQPQMQVPTAASPYTHVTIVPDGITIPIQG